ncbi:hypothetical protein BFX06_12055 [Sulfobacillus thermosulfidooxidans]|nr:hypothetical protein BFX05_09730 [Sulfobacillus thermosulfidooxidans]OLZ13256.1 hypothetical protein BFX06_12055 [Sulfobacillus thermosulfidooxidans]OLZ21636.1 hypothetical protein BFX07_12480 [Sulfobacillus thermosulfidooxidans]
METWFVKGILDSDILGNYDMEHGWPKAGDPYYRRLDEIVILIDRMVLDASDAMDFEGIIAHAPCRKVQIVNSEKFT